MFAWQNSMAIVNFDMFLKAKVELKTVLVLFSGVKELSKKKNLKYYKQFLWVSVLYYLY